AIVAIERSVELAGGSDGGGVPSRFLIALARGFLLSGARRRGEDGDGGFADGVASLELVSILQEEIELVGSNFHGLATGLPAATGLTRLGVLHHARVLHHVKPQRLVLIVEIKNKPVRRTVRNARAVRLEFSAAREDSLRDRIVRSHVYIPARARNLDDGWPAALDVNIAFRQHVLHRVVLFEQHGAFVGGQCPVRLFDARVLKSGLPGCLLNRATGAGDDRWMRAGSDDVN